MRKGTLCHAVCDPFKCACTATKCPEMSGSFLFVLGFYSPVNNEVMSSRSVNSGTVPEQASTF